ncbi:MAG: holo-ACP synthase [Actinomycetota bacterium]|nr:holo-ACP synthase [Actinomycetota bacterium]
MYPGAATGDGRRVIGIGIDAVDIERFRRVLARTPALARRLFTDDERAYAARFANSAPRLAGRFAAKEATMKALGVGLGAFGFHDVEVVRDPSGAPSLTVRGAAAALAGEQGVTGFRVSITHTALSAHAVVATL